MQSGPGSDAYLADPVRTAAVGTVVDLWQSRSLDHVARLATRLLDAPVGLLTAVGPDVQHHLGSHGLLASWAERRRLPLSYSFCRYVVISGAAIAIADAREDDRTSASPSVGELGFIAYLGIPLRSSGHVLGALCAIDHHPREWIGLEQRDLTDLAELCSGILTSAG
jgi:GAF domain-containing protein